MRKIRIFEHSSLDGVIEHDKNYAYGGWSAPYRSPEGMGMLLEAYGTGFDLLLGRKTYDEFFGVLAECRGFSFGERDQRCN